MSARIAICIATALYCGDAASQTSAFPLQEGVLKSDQNKLGYNIGVVDLEQTYNNSQIGRRIQSEFTNVREQLNIQNLYFDCYFGKQEIELASRKPTLDAEEFGKFRSDFSETVASRRDIQDKKGVLLNQWYEIEVNRFRNTVLNIAKSVAYKSQLDAVIFGEQTAYYKNNLELSQEFIQLLDNGLGDGTEEDGYVSAITYADLELNAVNPLDPDCTKELNQE